MAVITRGSKVVLDESALLQNATATPGISGDSDDNDILSASLPSVFSGFGTASSAALSGYTGAANTTGSDAFTLSTGTGAAVTDVSFVGPDGQPLVGLDSGLLTLDGTKIFLYTDTNNNVVLGRVGSANGTPTNPADDIANPNGTIAFAGYIQETLTGAAITGGKIWLATYQPIKHPDATNADDAVDLTGKVFVGVSQDAKFILEGAPSGQQLFLMFTTEGATPDGTGRIPGVSIIVTGRDPLNQSDSGAAITSADTVNSSQGGGSTTLGTNNQAITEQEGLRFTFVTGANANYTIPNLSPGEAGVESNIDFTAFFGARSATFQVVQETGGTTAMVKLTAINTAGSGGVNFIDSYVNDLTTERVAITNGSVTVKTIAGATISTAVITYNADGTVLITGVPTDAQIMYRTSTDHNRVLIENAGSLTAKNGDKTHADFDIGGFKVLQTSVDRLEIGSNIVFEDDGPSIAVSQIAAADALVVDETNLGFDATANFADNYGSTPNYGADGAGSVSSVYALGVKSAGVDSGLVDVASNNGIFLYLENAQVVGRVGTSATVANAAGAISFRVSVSASGTVTLDQVLALKHPDAANADDAVSPSAADLITLTRTDTVTDKDGDTNTGFASINIAGVLSFKDDGPSVSANAAVQLDDDALAGGIAGGTGDDANATNTTGTLGHAYGADGAGSVSLLTTSALPTGFSYDASSTATTLVIKQGTTTVLTVTLTDAATGAYSVTQNAAITHPAGNDENNVVFSVAYRVTDKDGDGVNGTLSINVDDDTPTATGTAVTGTVDEDGLTNGIAGGTGDVAGEVTTISGTVSGIFQAGADAPLSYGLSLPSTALQALSSGGTALVYSVASNTLTARAGAAGPSVFTFAITNTTTGAYTFTLLRPLDHATGNDENDITINLGTVVQATDKDGDTVTAAADKVVITVDDDSPNLAFGNLVGTGTDQAQYGFWSRAAGADGPNADGLQISLTGFQLGLAAQPTTSFSLSPTSANNWTGSLTGDFDNNAATAATTIGFTLSADPLTGKYALDLAAPVTSTTSSDTANGALGAGGPDAVQTLFIPATPQGPAETVVFFSAKVSASIADIAAGIQVGQPDPTEADLQGSNPPTTFASFIDPRSMNVSTSGIGVANNVLEGDSNAAIGGTGSTDESFVVNPLSLVSSVRVFVDNSVSGYKYTPGPGSGGNERLYYTAYYSDNTNSGTVLIDYDINTGGSSPKYFDVSAAGKMIDAVQLTMAKGDVKIPNIQFFTLVEGLANDISLDFTASLTDWDGDRVTSNFSADLFTNKAASAAFDYELTGTANAADAFNVDLSSARNDYKITGFDTTPGARDKIVLIGDAGAVVSNINNSGADSIVTITESLVGTQTTTVTVVGVDLTAGDLVLG